MRRTTEFGERGAAEPDRRGRDAAALAFRRVECYRFAVNLAAFRTYPLRRVAPAAMLAGIALAFLQSLDPMLNPDSAAFVAIAQSVLSGQGLRYQEPLVPGLDFLAFRAPGYPLFLALGFLLGGVTTVVAVQGALSGLSAALVGDLAGRLVGGGRPARAAWIAFALRMAWPDAWHHSALLLSEVPYEFLCVLATWLVLVGIERRQAGWCVAAAAATVGAILCRPVGLGVALPLGVALLVKFPRAAFVYGAAALLLWAPWPIRNARVLGAVIPFTTNGGATWWAGTLDGQVRPAYDWMGANVEVGEVGFDRHFRALAMENVKRDPATALRKDAQRAFIYLGPIRGRELDLWVHRFTMVFALVALALGAFRRLGLVFAIWLLQGAIMVPIYLIDRYRFPSDWCVVVAGAVGVSLLADRIGSRRATLAVLSVLALSLGASWALSLGMKPAP